MNSGSKASLKHNAFAATTCMRGPPCEPGNTAEFNFFSITSLAFARIIPDLGPLRVL